MMRILVWNIIALRDTLCVVWWLFLLNEGALIAQTNYVHFLKQRIYRDFNGGYNCVLIVRVQKCEWTIQNADFETTKRVPE